MAREVCARGTLATSSFDKVLSMSGSGCYENYVRSLQVPAAEDRISLVEEIYHTAYSPAHTPKVIQKVITSATITTLSHFVHRDNNRLCQPTVPTHMVAKRGDKGTHIPIDSLEKTNCGRFAPMFQGEYCCFPYLLDKECPDGNGTMTKCPTPVWSFSHNKDTMEPIPMDSVPGIASHVTLEAAKSLFNMVSIRGKNDFESIYLDDCDQCKNKAEVKATATNHLICASLSRLDEIGGELAYLVLANNQDLPNSVGLTDWTDLTGKTKGDIYTGAGSMIRQQPIRLGFLTGQASIFVAAAMAQRAEVEALRGWELWDDFWAQLQSKRDMDLLCYIPDTRSAAAQCILDGSSGMCLTSDAMTSLWEGCSRREWNVAYSVTQVIRKLGKELCLEKDMIQLKLGENLGAKDKPEDLCDKKKTGPPLWKRRQEMFTSHTLELTRKIWGTVNSDLFGPLGRSPRGFSNRFDKSAHTIQQGKCLKSPQSSLSGYSGNVIVALLRRFCATKVSAANLSEHCMAMGNATLKYKDFFIQDCELHDAKATGGKGQVKTVCWDMIDLGPGGGVEKLAYMVEMCFLRVQQHLAERALARGNGALSTKKPTKAAAKDALLWETFVGYCLAQSITRVYLTFGTSLTATNFHRLMDMPAEWQEGDAYQVTVLFWDVLRTLFDLQLLTVEIEALSIQRDKKGHATAPNKLFCRQLQISDFDPKFSLRTGAFLKWARGGVTTPVTDCQWKNVEDHLNVQPRSFDLFGLSRLVLCGNVNPPSTNTKMDETFWVSLGGILLAAATEPDTPIRRKKRGRRMSPGATTAAIPTPCAASSNDPLPTPSSLIKNSDPQLNTPATTVSGFLHYPPQQGNASISPTVMLALQANQSKADSTPAAIPEAPISNDQAKPKQTVLVEGIYCWKPEEGELIRWEGDIPENACVLTPYPQKKARVEEARQKGQVVVDSLLTPISVAEVGVIMAAMDPAMGPDSEDIAREGADSCQRKSLRTLRQGEWLNDEVIHYFLLMLQKRDKQLVEAEQRERHSHFFKSFFVTKLRSVGHTGHGRDGVYEYGSVERWSKNVPGVYYCLPVHALNQ